MGRSVAALLGALLVVLGLSGTDRVAATEARTHVAHAVVVVPVLGGLVEAGDPVGASAPVATVTARPGTQELPATLPTTGRAIPLLAAGIAIGVALLLRAGRSHFDDD